MQSSARLACWPSLHSGSARARAAVGCSPCAPHTVARPWPMDRVQLLNDMKRSATWSQKLEGRSAPTYKQWPPNNEHFMLLCLVQKMTPRWLHQSLCCEIVGAGTHEGPQSRQQSFLKPPSLCRKKTLAFTNIQRLRAKSKESAACRY